MWWPRCGDSETLLHCWWECKLVQPPWKTVWRFLKKLKIELPYNPAIALLGIYPRDTGVLFQRDTCIPMFIAALSTIAKVWKEPKFPLMDEWIMKMWCIYIYNGVFLGNQKEWKLAICNYTDGTRGYYAKQNYPVRERQISYDFTHMRTLRDKTDEHKGRETKII